MSVRKSSNLFVSETDGIIKGFIADYLNDSMGQKNHRSLSWKYCYEAFGNVKKIDDANCDYLALHLAAYLSSWGMYRGTSFLLQKNYKVHIPVVEIVLDDKYKSLRGISAAYLQKEKNLNLLNDISNRIRVCYKMCAGTGNEAKATDTLVTKILLGTLGCVPAFDKYVVSALRKTDGLSGNYNSDAVKKIACFYKDNKSIFEKIRKKLVEYPPMKLMDMFLWKKGLEIEKQNENVNPSDVHN